MRISGYMAVAACWATASLASAQEQLTVNVTTTTAGGSYSPKNVTAIWVQDANGNFVATVGRWARTRVNSLTHWVSKATSADTDAWMGATRANHGALQAVWNMRAQSPSFTCTTYVCPGPSGAVVPDGTYNIYMESTEANGGNPEHYAFVQFVKNGTAATSTPSATNFSNITLNYTGRSGSPAAGTLSFSSSTTSIDEAAGQVTLTVERSGGASGAVSVSYATSNMSAMAGSDYVADSGSLTFADGESSATFMVSITDDAVFENDEIFALTLTSPTGGAALGATAVAQVLVIDDDPMPGGSVCGDTIMNANEECDTTDFGGETCLSLGFAGGQPTCLADCTLQVDTCIGARAGEAPGAPQLEGCSAAPTGWAPLPALVLLAGVNAGRRRRGPR